jgi:hypothetical protein
MTDSKQIKAYARDASGQLIALAADTVFLEFPSGDSLEIAWDNPHSDDPRPLCVQLWGGVRPTQSGAKIDDIAQAQIRWLAILPSAGNLVQVHPYSIRKRE